MSFHNLIIRAPIKTTKIQINFHLNEKGLTPKLKGLVAKALIKISCNLHKIAWIWSLLQIVLNYSRVLNIIEAPNGNQEWRLLLLACLWEQVEARLRQHQVSVSRCRMEWTREAWSCSQNLRRIIKNLHMNWLLQVKMISQVFQLLGANKHPLLSLKNPTSHA